MTIDELAKVNKDYIINLRREFHRNPEASFKEFNTSKRIKEELGLSIMSYTGYTYDELKQMSFYRDMETTYRNRLLNTIDILVDGKFEINNQEGHHKFAGSKNQRVLYLKNGNVEREG